MQINIFYSWQSDTPSQFNRNLIEDCLKQAIRQMNYSSKLNFQPSFDRDTNKISGSPDIANAILDKISNSHIVVADVSIINKKSRKRLTPNPNVLCEIGFAAGKLGWENILLLCNEAFGKVEDLPFDIRGRRVLRYNINSLEERRIFKKTIMQSIGLSLRSIIENKSFIKPTLISELHSFLYNKLFFVEKSIEGYIINVYKNVHLEVPKFIEEDVFNQVSSKANPLMPVINYTFGLHYMKKYPNWNLYLTEMSQMTRRTIGEIFQFSNHLDKELLGACAGIDNLLSVFIETMPFPINSAKKGPTIGPYSNAIFNCLLYIRKANEIYYKLYGSYTEISRKQYLELRGTKQIQIKF